MTQEATIRPETPVDHEAVRAINNAAFGQPDEARLVDMLRDRVDPCISLVAEVDGRVVGHIMFTPVRVESATGSEPWQAMALAPMAVRPDLQRRGIGSALVRAGLDECRRGGCSVVFVLGHPDYYPRFGFRSAPPLGLRCEYDVPDDVFMVAELADGALGGRTGLVKYASPFREFD